MKKILVTGGSGFIGTNLVEYLVSNNKQVLSIDIRRPQNRMHEKYYRCVNILNFEELEAVIAEFSPHYIIHLAARTDLAESNDIGGYAANIQGVENLIKAANRVNSIERVIFTSSKLVCSTDYKPKSYEDYCPNTLYGHSKMLGEKIIKGSSDLKFEWCIVRPTSIWGPWSMAPHIPYGRFFTLIAKGYYMHPGTKNSPKSFGYVGNTIFQISKLLKAPTEIIHEKTFYLSDYDVFTIRQWVDIIALKLGRLKVHTIPNPIVRIIALLGDCIKLCGVKEPPITTFRLNNMWADTSRIPLTSLREITGTLPYSLENGVEETILWFKEYGILL